ncbi:MAG: IPT/TIG domain-containing protein [Bryobacteraceae bacterium]|nr:IPT/TIG domain-containing protein [Bryobacteraceae bacterium]
MFRHLLFFCASAALAQTAFDPFEKTIPELRAALDSRAITCTRLTQWYLDRIEALDRNGPRFNAIRALNPEALALAASFDRAPTRTPLACIPVIIKDNINLVGIPTTAGSVSLAASRSPRDAFLVQQLKAAGAIILAKANLTEFANYLTGGMPAGYSSLGGYVLNPHDPRPLPGSDGRQALSPGGSSAGSGASAAATFAAATVGTETSGSILSPANQNSVVGIKPTVGLISREGVIPIAASQDIAGPITRTVTDAAYLLGAMTGVDPRDPITAESAGRARQDYTTFLRADGLRGARIGVPRTPYWTNLTAEQRAITERAIAAMREAGATVIDYEIPTAAALAAFSSSVLRYEFKRDLNAYLASLGPDAPTRTLADVIAFNNRNAAVALKYGQTLAIASEATDLEGFKAQYEADRATDVRLARTEGLDAAFAAGGLTAILFPGTGGANIAARAGHPSIIVPAGYLSSGAPYGVMLTGPAYSEGTLISLGYAYEQASKIRRIPGSAGPLLATDGRIAPSIVRNLASGLTGPIAAGELISISGAGLGPADTATSRVTPEGRVDVSAGGTRVLFDGVPGPVLSARENLLVVAVPYAVDGKTTVSMTVERNGGLSRPLALTVAPAAPGVFPVIRNQDGSLNSAANPAPRGSIITMNITGDGRPTTLGIDGLLAAAPLAVPFLPVVVGINNEGVEVTFAGAAPGLTAITQVSARIPPATPSGASVPLVVAVGDAFSQALTVAVR